MEKGQEKYLEIVFRLNAQIEPTLLIIVYALFFFNLVGHHHLLFWEPKSLININWMRVCMFKSEIQEVNSPKSVNKRWSQREQILRKKIEQMLSRCCWGSKDGEGKWEKMWQNGKRRVMKDGVKWAVVAIGVKWSELWQMAWNGHILTDGVKWPELWQMA